MSSNTRQLLVFVAFAVVWSLATGYILGPSIPPFLTFGTWIVGFVFGVYVIAGGKTKDFGYFLAVWLGPFVIAGAFALLIVWDQSY